jgi:hypothetical protein
VVAKILECSTAEVTNAIWRVKNQNFYTNYLRSNIMFINRHNYEEYFLLYADGELQAADRQMVDEFVVRHPDLADELELLLSTVLPTPTHYAMPSKAGLLKPEIWDVENITPLQTNLLLHLDGELAETPTHTLNSQLAQDPHTQLEWQYLSNARLAPELVEMPNKASLYHTDDDTVVIPMYWIRRLAVAAAIIVLGWFVGSKLIATNSTSMPNGTLATTPSSPTNTIPKGSNTPTQITDESSPNSGLVVSDKKDNTNTLKPIITIEKKDDFKKLEPTPQNQEFLTQNSQEVPDRDLIGNSAQLASNGISNTQINNTLPTGVNLEKLNNATLAGLETTNTPANPLSQQAVYNEEPDTDEYVYIGGAKIKKQKVRNVFRTVGRTLGRTLEKNTIAQVVTETASLR